MSTFDQTKQKSMNRYEIIGVQHEATKVLNQLFCLEMPVIDTAMSNDKLWTDDLDSYDDEYGIIKCFYLNEADDIIFMFEDKETEENTYYYLDLSIWNGSFDNPLKKIK